MIIMGLSRTEVILFHLARGRQVDGHVGFSVDRRSLETTIFDSGTAGFYKPLKLLPELPQKHPAKATATNCGASPVPPPPAGPKPRRSNQSRRTQPVCATRPECRYCEPVPARRN